MLSFTDMTQPDKTTIFLIRHGAVLNPEGIFYGQHDIPLSEEGIDQSREVAASLSRSGLDMVISSDLHRCRFMGELISEQTGLHLKTDAKFREADFGKWTGLKWNEIEKGFPDEAASWINNPAAVQPPGGENMRMFKERVMPAFMDICRKKGQRKIALISHGGVNRAIISEILGTGGDCIFRIEQDFACINIIDIYERQHFSIRGINIPFTGAIH